MGLKDLKKPAQAAPAPLPDNDTAALEFISGAAVKSGGLLPLLVAVEEGRPKKFPS